MKYKLIKLAIALSDWLNTLVHHRKIIKGMQAELLKPFDIRLAELRSIHGHLEGRFEHPLVTDTARCMAEVLRKSNAANYMTATMWYLGDKYQMTIQRNDGKTPAERICELEKQIEELTPVPSPDEK